MILIGYDGIIYMPMLKSFEVEVFGAWVLGNFEQVDDFARFGRLPA